MECDICCEALDQAARVPKTLPCGHTACLQCLQRLRRGWCSDCCAAAARRCWDEHAVLNATAAERRLREQVPAGALQEAAALLPDVQCRGEEALHALTLLSAPSWALTLRAGGRQLNGNLANNEDPLINALWVLVASRAALTESGADGPSGDGPGPAAARPPAAAQDPPPAAARPPTAALDLPPAAARSPAAALDPPPAEAPPPREMDVVQLALRDPGEMEEQKAAALQEAQGVERLVGVRCERDHDWCLELLQRAAPTLERLEVLWPDEPHLRAVHAIPRQRRLRLYCDDVLDAAPPELGALPPGHSGLRWLSVRDLPRATLQSLLRAHSGTLEELELGVGTPGEEEWPVCCSDLHSLLGRCGLRALRRLVLERERSDCTHTVTGCREQLAAVRAALPGVQVLCGQCDSVPDEEP
ncbi:Protein piccolo [Frankliniella fusca]|uniref:Protein piccolo n=1 Tax=Frankliniella fusca TaxID=407009 RepID=A0AAE1HIV2_9NEOP|nr:Protein piccolo [Frankliniella fusca]